MNKKAPIFECPSCGKPTMSVVQKRDDNKQIEYECTGCLSWWILKHYEMSNGDLIELAQT